MNTIEATDVFNDEKIVTLICLGAATAANCIPCFEHLYEKAQQAGLTEKEIQGAAQLASIVKKGAHLAIKSSIDELIGTDFEAHEELPLQPCGCTAQDPANSCAG
jgi:alkylhydroperoxidase/carboxymuconolactone decarboxylase family protein YurZ